MITSKKVFLIGDINIDLALRGLKQDMANINWKVGPELKIDDFSFEIGGSGFNFIKALSSFGVEIDFYGKTGDDIFGDYINKYLKKEKIQNSIVISKKIKTGITIVIPIGNNRIFFTFTGGNEYLNFKDLDLSKIIKFNHVHLSSFYLLKNLQDDVIKILKYLKSLDITTSFDTGYDPDDNWQRQKIFEILEYVDIFIPNEVEALNITNKNNIEEAINLLSKYCPIVVIKLGSKGLVAKYGRRGKSKTIFLSTYDIEVVDTSCSGDCFDAGFIYGYLNGYDFERSLDFANACGSLQASKLGSYKFEGIFEIENLMEVTKKVNLN
jgi:sugar/nucleoside kinase (ribokinase family)